MKIIHLSDTHINPKTLYNLDSQNRFESALQHIKNTTQMRIFLLLLEI